VAFQKSSSQSSPFSLQIESGLRAFHNIGFMVLSS
jgi:hypothetical protein